MRHKHICPTDSAPWPKFNRPTIGAMVRDAYDNGVAPDFVDVPGSFDDKDGESRVVDAYGNPKTDPMEIMDAHRVTQMANLTKSIQSDPAPKPTPAPAPDPTPAPAPNPTPAPAAE